MNRQLAAEAVLRRRSPLLVRFFEGQFARQLRRNFNAVRLSKAGPLPILDKRPLVIYSNHPAWWDAVVYFHLGRTLLRDRTAYGPVSAAQLERYPFLDRLGMFGIEPDTAQGASRFLAIGKALFSHPSTMMWVAGEGHFADPRRRPVSLRGGIARLAHETPDLVFLPLAMEYQFWIEKRPEILLRFGTPITVRADGLEEALEAGLTEAMDHLASETERRDPTLFETLLEGDQGIHRLYDILRRLHHMMSGKPYRPGHHAP